MKKGKIDHVYGDLTTHATITSEDVQKRLRGNREAIHLKSTVIVQEYMCSSEFMRDLKAMEPKDRARYILDLAKYAAPVTQEVNVTTDDARSRIDDVINSARGVLS